MLRIRKQLTDYTRDSYLTEEKQTVNSNLPVIDCEVGYSPFGASPHMLASIAKIDFSAVARYPEMFYTDSLKPKIIERFSKADITARNIFFGHGSFNLAERIIHKFVEAKAMLGYGPQFNEVPTEMEAAGGQYKSIPLLDNFDFPLDEIIRELKTQYYSVLYIDNPNNPTGFLLPLETFEQFLVAAESAGTIIVIDEAYGDFVPDECSAFNLVRKYSNLMVIRSMSKALGLAAQRIGYMAISDPLVQYYSKIDVPFEPTLLSAIMAELTLSDHQYITRVRELSRECKSQIINALIEAEIKVLPTHPNVSILTAYKPDINLFTHFQNLSIKVENGAAYIRTNRMMSNSFIRIRVPDQEQTTEVVQRILAHSFKD